MAQTLTESQLESLVVIERTSAILSLTGTAFVVTTFWASKAFRTLSNTLIFYASFGNVLSNVAHLAAIAGVRAGPNSALCQMQGFLQQM
jgi:cation transporter-like permease